MAVESNSSDEQVVNVPKAYTGIGNFKVLLVNPNKEELAKLGVNLEDDPTYTGLQMNDEEKNKVVFWVQSVDNADILTRLEIIVAPNFRTSQNDNAQFINKFGQTTWAKDEETLKANPKMSWFSKEGLRKAYEGEETLINFIGAWANVKSDSELSLDTAEQIMKGNVGELKQLVNVLTDNQVQLLLGVDDKGDKQYQKVYTKFFGRAYGKNTGFIKSLKAPYGEFKSDYDRTDFTLKEFEGNGMGEAPSSDEAAPATDYFNQ